MPPMLFRYSLSRSSRPAAQTAPVNNNNVTDKHQQGDHLFSESPWNATIILAERRTLRPYLGPMSHVPAVQAIEVCVCVWPVTGAVTNTTQHNTKAAHSHYL